jgi:hypothetical protein
LFDVLEHVEADIASLRTLSQLLKPGGKILITVPAYPWMWSSHDVELHHFRRYTRSSLRRTLNDAGLKPDKLTNFNTVLFPAAVAARAANSILRGSSPGSGMPSARLNSVLTFLFSIEKYVMRVSGFPCGLSLLAVASKRCTHKT